MLIDCSNIFEEAPILQCRYNGIDVTCHFIRLSQYGYLIEIDCPFSGFSTASAYVPSWSKKGFKHYITDKGTISEHCIIYAKQDLQKLYQNLVFFEQNRERISQYYSEIKKALEAHERYKNCITHDEFLKLRIELRKERKAWSIDNIQYQKRLAGLTLKKNNTRHMKFELNSQLRDCIMKEFGHSMGHDFIEQIINNIAFLQCKS